MELDWFLGEVAERTKWCDFPPLVTTCTDGENGGWFRNVTEGANYWTAFYLPLLERVRAGTAGISPTFISDYLNIHGVHGEVKVRTGAWNTGWHHGRDFTQWTGSEAQKATLADYAQLSKVVHDARWYAGEHGVTEGPRIAALDEALWRLLRAETSCNLYWGEAWVPRAEADLQAVREVLARIGIDPAAGAADSAGVAETTATAEVAAAQPEAEAPEHGASVLTFADLPDLDTADVGDPQASLADAALPVSASAPAAVAAPNER